MKHRASPRFWWHYRALPDELQHLADCGYPLLLQDPRHSSLHFKRIGRLWSVRVGLHHRSPAIERDGEFVSILVWRPCGVRPIAPSQWPTTRCKGLAGIVGDDCSAMVRGPLIANIPRWDWLPTLRRRRFGKMCVPRGLSSSAISSTSSCQQIVSRCWLSSTARGIPLPGNHGGKPRGRGEPGIGADSRQRPAAWRAVWSAADQLCR